VLCTPLLTLVGCYTQLPLTHEITKIIGLHLFHFRSILRRLRSCEYVLPVRSGSRPSDCVRFVAAAMSYQLYNFLRQVRRARRPQIRIIPLAIRLVIFMFYLVCGFVYVSPLCVSISHSHLTICRPPLGPAFGP
jgi:hypothetical protein